mmetsp:Transcript_148321/g.476286  ORF Transcript_148321/g.476286 Transcript_148321/m.476286 type:complete len:177 (-) Transcript_148321:94-624(-)
MGSKAPPSQPVSCRHLPPRVRAGLTLMARTGHLTCIAWLAHLVRLLGTACLGFGLLGLGAASIVNPVMASAMFGLPVTTDLVWVQVAGVRDIALGLGTLAIWMFYRPALRIFTPVTLVVAAGDAVITMQSGGVFPSPFNHLFGVVGISVLSVAAWLDPTLKMPTVSDPLLANRDWV